MNDRVKVLIRHVLLSVFVAPLVIELAVLRRDVLSHESLAAVARDYAFGYIFVLLSFGIGLLVAGLLSGAAVAASLRRRRIAQGLTVVAPTLALPASIVVSFFIFTTGVPLIQNGDPYVVASAVGGVVVGLLALLGQNASSTAMA